MSEAIFVEGLTKAYNGKTVVDHLNLSVKSGTVFGLLGANGAGKSTTIECMLGTKQADSGTEAQPAGHECGDLRWEEISLTGGRIHLFRTRLP